MWRLIWILLLVKILEFTWEHRDNFSLLDSYHGILAEFFFLKLTFFMPQGARSKTRKPRKSRKFFLEIFESEFSILAVGQNRKLGNKKTRNNISEISEVSEFSICHFFIFQKTFFFQFSTVGNSVLSIYDMFCFQGLWKCFFLHQKYMFKILPCHNEIYLLWDLSTLMRTWVC